MTADNIPPSRAVALLNRLLPGPVYRVLRFLIMAVFTPSVYAAQHGYYRSLVARSVVAPEGAAAPWMTFPLVAFLETVSFRDRSVIEFGSGQSTLWWGKRAKSVVALETDGEWFERIAAEAPPNVDVVKVPLEFPTQAAFNAGVSDVAGSRRFDVVVVDGGDRPKALHAAPDVITDDGFIVLDDLDLFIDDPRWIDALESLKQQGFGRIDFYGLAVSAPFTRARRCTSILFRDGSFVTGVGRVATQRGS